MTDAVAVSRPHLSAAESEAFKDLWLLTEEHKEITQRELTEELLKIPEWVAITRATTPAQALQLSIRVRELQRAAFMEDDWRPYLQDLREQGLQYARNGTSFNGWFKILTAYREIVRRRVAELARSDVDRSLRIGDAMNRMMDVSLAHIGDAYLSAKEQIIADQQEAIREISTPVLQVSDRVLIIPIVGLVDTHRARHLTVSLLSAIRERRAKGVVMDITGVPVVDSKVANHLAQACEAARLMGAMVVMTGISSEIALTLVTIGAQLRGVHTVGDLQGGIEEIERFMRGAPTLEHAAVQGG